MSEGVVLFKGQEDSPHSISSDLVVADIKGLHDFVVNEELLDGLADGIVNANVPDLEDHEALVPRQVFREDLDAFIPDGGVVGQIYLLHDPAVLHD